MSVGKARCSAKTPFLALLLLELGSRQAGAAIEGAVRQKVVDTIERIAVATHGYTDFAMGWPVCLDLVCVRG